MPSEGFQGFKDFRIPFNIKHATLPSKLGLSGIALGRPAPGGSETGGSLKGGRPRGPEAGAAAGAAGLWSFYFSLRRSFPCFAETALSFF